MVSSAPPQSIKPKRGSAVIILAGFIVAAVFMGSDFIEPSFGRLDHLGITYPHFVKFGHIIAGCAALIICFIFRRSNLIAFLALVGTVVTVTSLQKWTERQVAVIHITRFLEGEEYAQLETRMGFKIAEIEMYPDIDLLVDHTPGRDAQLTTEAKRLGIWRP